MFLYLTNYYYSGKQSYCLRQHLIQRHRLARRAQPREREREGGGAYWGSRGGSAAAARGGWCRGSAGPRAPWAARTARCTRAAPAPRPPRPAAWPAACTGCAATSRRTCVWTHAHYFALLHISFIWDYGHVPLKPYTVKLRIAHIYSVRDIYVVLCGNFSTTRHVSLKLYLQQ